MITATQRLLLEPLDDRHLDAVHAIYADPGTWRHLPAGRFADRARTETMIARAQLGWRSIGLGPWAVRVREEHGAGADTGEVIGTAGCSMLTLPAWNLGYRFTPSAWGRGYATEAGAAALAAARQTRPDVPVTARALTANPASIRVLERLGLQIVWRGRSTECETDDPSNPSGDTRGVERVIAADRDLDQRLLAGLIDLG